MEALKNLQSAIEKINQSWQVLMDISNLETLQQSAETLKSEIGGVSTENVEDEPTQLVGDMQMLADDVVTGVTSLLTSLESSGLDQTIADLSAKIATLNEAMADMMDYTEESTEPSEMPTETETETV